MNTPTPPAWLRDWLNAPTEAEALDVVIGAATRRDYGNEPMTESRYRDQDIEWPQVRERRGRQKGR